MPARTPSGVATPKKIASLENRLSGVLRPVAPRKEFVRELSHHFQAGNQTALVDRRRDWHLYALLLTGLVSFALLLAVSLRALFLFRRKKRLPQG